MTLHRIHIFTGLLALAGIGEAGCDSDSNPPADSAVSDTHVAGEASLAPDGGAKTEGGTTPDGNTTAGKTVLVTYDGKSYTVDVSKPTPVVIDGVNYARLSDVVALALPGKAQDTLTADFEGEGGFRPGSKSNCIGLVPVAGEKLAKGYAQTESLNMRWDDDLGYPGCLAPKGLQKIILANK
jgi:hypothetical protein